MVLCYVHIIREATELFVDVEEGEMIVIDTVDVEIAESGEIDEIITDKINKTFNQRVFFIFCWLLVELFWF